MPEIQKKSKSTRYKSNCLLSTLLKNLSPTELLPDLAHNPTLPLT